MKLVNAIDLQTIMECQSSDGSELPSDTPSKRS